MFLLALLAESWGMVRRALSGDRGGGRKGQRGFGAVEFEQE